MTTQQWQIRREIGVSPLESVAHQTKVFCILWAFAHISHVLRHANRCSDPFAWLLMAAAVLLVDKPSSRVRLGALTAIQITYLVYEMPWIPNHLYLLGFVNLGLLTAVLMSLQRRESDGSVGLQLPRRYVFATVLLSYGAAALAKLNAGFFDTETSCAVSMFYHAVAVFGVEPGALRSLEFLMPFLIAGTELVIPTLLLITSTRRAGVVLVVLFHWVVSLSPTAAGLGFTSVIFALVFLFLPLTAATRVYAVAQRGATLVPASTRTAFFVLLSFFLAISLVAGHRTFAVLGSNNWIWLAVAVLAVGTLLLLLALTVPAHDFTPETPRPRLATVGFGSIAYAAFIALQLVNISAPYLGSKNVGSFVMYSNLQTELRRSNHFFIPRLPLEMGQDDLVEIVDSSSKWLRQVKGWGQWVSWHELRRHLSERPDVSLTYRRNDVLYSYERADQNSELVRRDPLAHRFIAHRYYNPYRARCVW